RRALRDRALAKRLRTVLLIGADGFRRDLLCLPLQALPGWLYGITTGKVRADLVEKIDRYRDECFDVLWNHFKVQIVPGTPPPPPHPSPAKPALPLAEGVARLARQHLDLEQRHISMADYLRPFVQQTRQQLSQHEQQLGAHETRIEALELRLGTSATISEA